jgi:hypothetical protein
MLENVEGHTHGRATRERLGDRRGHRPWHVQKLLVREPGIPRPTGGADNARCTGPHREGEEPKPMMHDHGKSDFAIVGDTGNIKQNTTNAGSDEV